VNVIVISKYCRYCSKCKEHKEATKKLDLWKLPKILVIHLKRFTTHRAWRDKNDVFVDFPLTNLDLSSYAPGEKGKSAIYDLYAVSVRFLHDVQF
jgi:ubiquitin C-terminal hydrolase